MKAKVTKTNQYDAYMAGYAQGETDEKFRTKPIVIKDKWHFPDKGDYPEDVKLSEFETYNPLVLVFMYRYDDYGKAAKVYALDRWEKEPFNRWQNMHTDFSGRRSGGLVFPSLLEFSIVCCDPHSQRL